ncbi:MAG: HpcH/HpaI aldolase family protein [Shimia sp.]
MRPVPENILKRRLLAGERTQGVWLNTGSPVVAEIAGMAGFDWALIDMEHGPSDMGSLGNELRALAATGTPAVVRVPSKAPEWISRVMDLGAQSVMVPMVNTVEEAERAARAMRYPPNGTRGMGAALARAGGYGTSAAGGDALNEEACFILQVETAAAIENIEAFAAIPGVDCIFIGSLDLSYDLGHGGEIDHPEVMAKITDARRRIEGAGKPCGMIELDPAKAAELRGNVGFLGIASDTSLLTQALQDVRHAS